jgi:hypothetical protein
MGSGLVKAQEGLAPWVAGALVAGFRAGWVRRPQAGVKVERPTGRTTLTLARTGAGSGGEKARTIYGVGSHAPIRARCGSA